MFACTSIHGNEQKERELTQKERELRQKKHLCISENLAKSAYIKLLSLFAFAKGTTFFSFHLVSRSRIPSPSLTVFC